MERGITISQACDRLKGIKPEQLYLRIDLRKPESNVWYNDVWMWCGTLENGKKDIEECKETHGKDFRKQIYAGFMVFIHVDVMREGIRRGDVRGEAYEASLVDKFNIELYDRYSMEELLDILSNACRPK